MERLLAQPVAGQQQFLLALVINGEGKHASQFLHAVRPHLFVEVDDDFRIGVRPEIVAPLFEFGSQVGKVIDFAVEDNPGVCGLR